MNSFYLHREMIDRRKMLMIPLALFVEKQENSTSPLPSISTILFNEVLWKGLNS